MHHGLRYRGGKVNASCSSPVVVLELVECSVHKTCIDGPATFMSRFCVNLEAYVVLKSVFL